jgi:hypothetical protein
MVDGVQTRKAYDNEVNGDNVVQQPRSNENQNSRDESDDRRDMSGCEMHDDLRVGWLGWKDTPELLH